jgi:hypothetical protein
MDQHDPHRELELRAREAFEAGFSVVPPKQDGSKRPIGEWKKYQENPPSWDQVNNWVDHGTGLGIVCGRVSGNLELFEFDDLRTYTAYRDAAIAVGLGDLVERIESGYLETSPGNGVHWFYRCSKVDGNTLLARRPDPVDPQIKHILIETRGEGGYAVVAPSYGKVHPSGKPYKTLRGEFATIITITPTEKEALWDLARSFDELPVPPDTTETTGARQAVENSDPFIVGPHVNVNGQDNSERRFDPGDIPPGKDFADHTAWEAILVGWKKVYTHNEITHWRRPGKEEGTSATTRATVDHQGRPTEILYVFSTRTQFPPNESINKFRAYAILNHAGDLSEAGKHLYAEGYGSHAARQPVQSVHPPQPAKRGPGRPRKAPQGAVAVADRPVPDEGPQDQSEVLERGELPQVFLGTDEHRCIDETEQLMISEPNLFHRGNRLVNVVRDSVPGPILRAENAPTVCPVIAPKLRYMVSRNVEFVHRKKNDVGEYEIASLHPTAWLVNGLLALQQWPSLRYLDSVVETPVLRPDGTILDTPGWDATTGILYEPAVEYPKVPKNPRKEDGVAAATKILEVVQDFPFATPTHKAVFLSAFLAPVARACITSPCPLVLFDANTPGSGKTKLADIIANTHTGRDMPRTAYTNDDEEMRKRITAIALAAERMILLDNIAAHFGGSSLDAAITATSWQDRALGKNELTPVMPLNTCWYASGNNVVVRGDMIRRVLPCRLESKLERPEERDDFTIKENILEHVRRFRPKLVVAALTMLRAHFLAGRPTCGLAELGSFESWSTIIRNCVRWIINIDPCEARLEFRLNDPETILLRGIVNGWRKLPACETMREIREVVRYLNLEPETYNILRQAFMQWSDDSNLPPNSVIGKRLLKYRDRVVDGWMLRSDNSDDSHKWFLEFVKTKE